MQSIDEWLKQSIQVCQRPPTTAHSGDLKTSDLRALLCHHLSCDNAWLFAHPEHPLSKADCQQLNAWVEQLRQGFPLAYITGKQLFWDLELMVNSATLIPRADTETVVESAIKLLSDTPPNRILDLGTGSGALALALARVFPAAQVTATDMSQKALRTAQANAVHNQIHNCQFMSSNWFAELPIQAFDLIVSNPPYIAADDEHLIALRHEPQSALIAAQNGLADLARIITDAPPYLADQGWLLLEHGWQQQAAVSQLLQQTGYMNLGCEKDLAGHHRVSYGQRPTER